MVDFVNPYTFVPLVREPERKRPPGHAALEKDQFDEDRLSGVLSVTLTTRTPLLIGGYKASGGTGSEAPDVPRRADGTPMVPGSGFLGAVRSVHEALAGGCMRVLDTDWVAVHRHPASTAETDALRLAMVLDVDGTGRARRAALCDPDVVWVDQTILPRDHGRVPRTGDRVRLPDKAFNTGSRLVLRPGDVMHGDVKWVAGMSTALDDSWVLLATDTHARGKDNTVYFAAGRVGPGAQRCPIPDLAWDTYCKVVDGADDLRPANLPNKKEPEWESRPPEYANVPWPLPEDGQPPPPTVAERLVARHYLHKGQPIWVRVASDGSISEIRLSQLWRYQGSYPVGERASAAVPCTDPNSLCRSCRIFGSADVSGRRDDDVSVQRSYRGHVRVDDLLATADFEPLEWHLAPLAAPRPSAGQFYLDNTGVPPRDQVAAKDTRPANTWGSCADEGRKRPIRGRKFYWRTTEPEKAAIPRGQHRHQSDTQSRDVALIPARRTFAGRVCFENLSTQEFGSLLAALDPRLLAGTGLEEWAGVVTSVGGGKPFGFGAVNVRVAVESVQTAAGRYLGADDEVPGTDEAVQAFRASVPHEVSATWTALRNVLTFGSIPDDLVWYPPGLKGAKGDADYDHSFEFFSRTTGLALTKKVRDLIVLPAADGPASAQILHSTDGERPADDSEQPRGGRGGGRQSRPQTGRRP
jgi:CRISPR-associated protein (TIGR03986 family)